MTWIVCAYGYGDAVTFNVYVETADKMQNDAYRITTYGGESTKALPRIQVDLVRPPRHWLN